jgi:hypothetical protein
VAIADVDRLLGKYIALMDAVKLKAGLQTVMELSSEGNRYMQETKPWELKASDPARCASVLHTIARIVRLLAAVAEPFMPGFTDKVLHTMQLPHSDIPDALAGMAPIPPGHAIHKPTPLFNVIPVEQVEALRFARLLPVAGASGLPVVAYGARSLAGILASSGVAVAQSDAPPESVPLARLAGYLRPDPKQLSLPPLLPEPTQRARWEKALEGRPRPVIAIACGGGAGEPDLAGLLAALGTGGTLLSLLIGPPRGHIGMYPSLLDGGAHVQDLDDLGAALAAADYVVVGEGVTGHLAGNLGLQGAVLLPPIADWCWGPRNADGLWYQGLTACRAEAARGMPDWTDWAPALAALAVLAADWQARSGRLVRQT